MTSDTDNPSPDNPSSDNPPPANDPYGSDAAPGLGPDGGQDISHGAPSNAPQGSPHREPLPVLPNRAPEDFQAVIAANDPMQEDGPYSGRIAPCNIEAEQAVLGALLLQNEVYFRLSSFLTPEHFYEPLHQRLYSVMEDLIATNRVADPVTLKPRFEDDEAMAEVGGIGYLANLASASISIYNAVDYAHAVFDMAIRRGLIAIGEDMVGNAFDGNAEEKPQDQIEAAEQQLFSLAEAGQQEGGFIEFSKALKESLDMTTAAYKRGSKLSGISTGLQDLDKQLGGLQQSDLLILAARPAMGKSSLACNIAFNVAKAYKKGLNADGNEAVVDGAAVGIFSLEMSAEQLATRLIAEESGVPSNQIRRGQINEDEYRSIHNTIELLESVPLFIDDTGGISIAQLTARARRLKRNHGIGLLIIDYVQLITGSGKKVQENRVQEITQITMGLKALAKELNIPIIALAQLSRQVENREDKRPQLADLRESGSIEQDADVVMFIYREDYYLERQMPDEGEFENFTKWQDKMSRAHGRAEVIVAKQRHGPTGMVPLAFQAELTKFSDLAKEDHYDPSNLDR
jgi:replicative DNA helicase